MRLLIVEDQAEIAESLKSSFRAENFEVDISSEGLPGLYLATVNNYDTVILDLGLPDKSGGYVCQELRRRGKTMPIIILSVHSETIDKVALLNVGADDYVTKPFAFSELLARVRAALRRPPALQTEALTYEDLELYIHDQRVLRAGQEIYLTRKEFELLHFLLRNQGKVVSRGMIMEHVWDMNADPFSNTLETHILNLRRKIDATGLPRLIHTVPTRGYRLALAH